MLIINAEDDPIADVDGLPIEKAESNDNVCAIKASIATTRHTGC